MKILVTGGAGFVGSVLVPLLLERGHEVTVFDSLRYGGTPLLGCFASRRFHFVKGDVCDEPLLRQQVARADAVVHLAGIVGFPACRKYPQEAERTHVEGTRGLVRSLGREQVLVYASSGSNYGALEEICTEESPLNPVSWYAVTKARGEEIALEAPGAIALRFATGFGVSPRFRLDLLINDFVHQAVVNKQIIVYERAFRRTFIHVRDMARSVLFALDHFEKMRGAPFNVGHESLNLTKEAIARAIRERVPFYLHFAEIGQDADRRDYEVSYKKIRALGFEAETTLESGIDELIRAVAVVESRNPYVNI